MVTSLTVTCYFALMTEGMVLYSSTWSNFHKMCTVNFTEMHIKINVIYKWHQSAL